MRLHNLHLLSVDFTKNHKIELQTSNRIDIKNSQIKLISKKTISRKKIDHHIIYSLGLDYASCLNSRALLFTDMHGPIRSSLSRNVS